MSELSFDIVCVFTKSLCGARGAHSFRERALVASSQQRFFFLIHGHQESPHQAWTRPFPPWTRPFPPHCEAGEFLASRPLQRCWRVVTFIPLPRSGDSEQLPFAPAAGPWARATHSGQPSNFWLLRRRACWKGITFSVRCKTFTRSSLEAGKRRAGKMPWKEEADPARSSSFQSQRVIWLVPQSCLPTEWPAETGLRERRVRARNLRELQGMNSTARPTRAWAIPFREIVSQGLQKWTSLLSYSAFSGPRRDDFPPFRGNLVHDIHLENSVNLRMWIAYQSFGLARMAFFLLNAPPACGSHTVHFCRGRGWWKSWLPHGTNIMFWCMVGGQMKFRFLCLTTRNLWNLDKRMFWCGLRLLPIYF